MRMKDVIISVTGVQQGVNGPDAMELVTAGQYGQDEKETLLTWQESELTGMEGTKTSLCVQRDGVVLSREGKLNDDSMLDIMMEQKKPEKNDITLSGEKLRKYFPRSYTPFQIENTIFKLLDAWQKKRQRDQSR